MTLAAFDVRGQNFIIPFGRFCFRGGQMALLLEVTSSNGECRVIRKYCALTFFQKKVWNEWRLHGLKHTGNTLEFLPRSI